MAPRVFSFGGGVQSTAALVLAARGEIDFPVFLFANVGDDSEDPKALKYIEEYSKPYASDHKIDLIELHRIPSRGKDKGKKTTIYSNVIGDNRSIIIPIFMKGGAPGRRGCTTHFKAKVIEKWTNSNGGTKESPAIVGMGISIDEIQRMKDSRTDTQKFEYPLIDLRLSRSDCRKIILDSGLPVPPKSSCWFCPFHKKSQWIEMKTNRPDLFQRAIDMEHKINEKRKMLGKDRVYLHSSRTPLENAVPIQDSFIDEIDDFCDSGFCFV